MTAYLTEPDTALTVHDAIRRRRSPLAFADTPVPRELLQSLFEAARWSASSYNEQPWRFVVATRENPEAYDALLSAVNEKNRRWASRAPVLVGAITRTRFSGRERDNRHSGYDLGAAMATLTLQATEYDLYVHQMAGFSPERLREVAGIPDEFEAMAMAAIGYRGDPADLPEDLRDRATRERTRRSLEDTVFGLNWGEHPW